jgi:hypothetical protein
MRMKQVLIFVSVLGVALLLASTLWDYAYSHRDDVTVGPDNSRPSSKPTDIERGLP